MTRGITLSLVIGRDGATTFTGSSQNLTTESDRAKFLARRRRADVILIGGQTARSEPYEKTPVPLVILSRTLEISANPQAFIWRCSVEQSLARAEKEFGPHIHIEGGPKLFHPILHLISTIYLTISPQSGGENIIEWQKMFSDFTVIDEEVDNETTFLILKNNNLK